MKFEWDENKAAANEAKHGVSFDEAQEVFSDPRGVEEYDAEHSFDEPRFSRLGWSSRRLLFVVFVERRSDVYRVISARQADTREERIYADANR